MLHLTVGHPKSPSMLILRESAVRHGFSHQHVESNNANGRIIFIDKLRIVKTFIDRSRIPQSSIIVFTDAYDTIILANALEIKRNFVSMDCDLLFNAERNFWPPLDPQSINYVDDMAVKQFFETSFVNQTCYLNSGCYIGYAGSISRMLDYCVARSDELTDHDDQRLAGHFFVRSNDLRVKCMLDIESKVFGTLGGSLKDYDYYAGSVYNRRTGSWPSIIHANGDKEPMLALSHINRIQRIRPQGIDLLVVCSSLGYMKKTEGPESFMFSWNLSREVVVLYRLSSNRTVALSTNFDGFLSFTPHNTIVVAKALESWEVLSIEERGIMSFHNTPLSNYISDTNIGGLELLSAPLELLLHFDSSTIDRMLLLLPD